MLYPIPMVERTSAKNVSQESPGITPFYRVTRCVEVLALFKADYSSADKVDIRMAGPSEFW